MAWADREQPILEALLAAEEAGESLDMDDLVERMAPMPPHVVRACAVALYESDHITGTSASAFGSGFFLLDIRLLEKGRIKVGQWPSEDPFESLVALLDEVIASESDPEKRSRFVRLKDALTAMGTGTATALFVAWFKRRTNLP